MENRLRIRKEIERDLNHYSQHSKSEFFTEAREIRRVQIIAELLLDIRDLLPALTKK